MKFKSKIEAYLYTLYLLQQMLSTSDNKEAILAAINSIRRCIEDHVQDTKMVADILKNLCKYLTAKNEITSIQKLICSIRKNKYELSPTEKFENPLGRRFESQIHIEMLQQPTTAMMESVKKVSDKIVEILTSKSQCHFMPYFRKILARYPKNIAFGCFETKPTKKKIITIFKENSPEDLSTIMFMHVKFAQRIVRKIDKEYEKVANTVKFIADTSMSQSTYYHDRGRKDKINRNFHTSKMGLLITSDGLYNIGLPEHLPEWIPDAKAQAADLESSYVKNLINNDVPYVAGPSGLTALFIGQMLAFNLEDNFSLQEMQYYIAAITAYIISAGFHSLHEIMGPIVHCLPGEKLFPYYDSDLEEEFNYSGFYEYLGKIDPDFIMVHEAAWAKLMHFFENEYLPQADHLHTSKKSINGMFLSTMSIFPKSKKPIDDNEEEQNNYVNYHKHM